MKRKKLEKACRMAGLHLSPVHDYSRWTAEIGTLLSLPIDHPALPHYVAHLLALKIEERGLDDKFSNEVFRETLHGKVFTTRDSANIAIKCAMRVLKDKP